MRTLDAVRPLWIGLALSAAVLACGETASPTAAGSEEAHSEGEVEHDEEEGVVELTAEAAERAGIKTALVEERKLPAILETTGIVDFDQDRLAHVGPRVAGRVVSTPVPLGAEVRSGQPLATLDSIELGQARATYLQARARSELAKESYDREQGLYADRIASQQEMLAAQAAWREAQADLQAAEETLHLYGLAQQQVDELRYDDPQASIHVVSAPFSGTVVEKHAALGELVSPEDALFLVADLARLWLWIDVYERDLRQVHRGDRAEVRADAFPDRVFRGEVSYLSDRVDPDARTIRARIDVDNADRSLRPGMFARVRLSDPHAGGGEGAPVLAVPEAALQKLGESSVVFVPLGENRFEARAVEVGRRADGWVEVIAGVAAGERVVIAGAFILKSEASQEQLGGGHSH